MVRIDEEKEMVRDLAIKTTQRIVAPRASEIDVTGEIPKELIECLGKQGLLSVLLPDEFEGIKGDIFSLSLIVEEMAKVSGSIALFVLAQSIGTLPIIIGGNDSQKERFFKKIAQDHALTAFALNEAEIEFDLQFMKTFARREAESYFINGHKCSVIHGRIAQIYTVFAKTLSEKCSEFLSAFLVEGQPSGLQFGEIEERIGMKGVVSTDIILEECQIPSVNILGGEGEGEKIAKETILRSRPAIGALAVGLAQGAIDYAIGYANERIQFGKPISSFQAIQFMIADMATQTEVARTLVYQAAQQIEIQGEARERESAIAKIFATDTAMKVTTDAVQILGGYGYIKDYPLERMMRDAKVMQLYGEPNQLQRWMIVQQFLKG
ncbi:MAG: acyl-CoA dehydrogenase family protein [Thermodesulfobacteriota bacterium]